MRQLLQFLFRKPVMWLSLRFDAKPDKERIYNALSKLFKNIQEEPGKNGLIIPLEQYKGKIIIFSDQHKGRRNGADDFTAAEPNYMAALQYYSQQQFCFINLGDCEELWENTWQQIKKANAHVFAAEKKFITQNAYVKIFGNHDLYWASDPLATRELENLYGTNLKVYEGVIITTSIADKTLYIFCTHGHQGDARSDGNRFTKFFVARIWAPLQAYLRINTNEPSNDAYKKTVHNEIMYEWSALQKNTLLITGHTHQPVFESLTHIERLNRQWIAAKNNNDADTANAIMETIKPYKERFETIQLDFSNYLPSYFNTGCCCFSDGDITGIELENNCIRLIKWRQKEGRSQRIVLEEKDLQAFL